MLQDALPGPQITDAIYITFVLTLFPLGGLSQQKGCKGISCWSPPLPGPGCMCALYITSRSCQCHLQIISPWTDNGEGGEKGGFFSSWGSILPPLTLAMHYRPYTSIFSFCLSCTYSELSHTQSHSFPASPRRACTRPHAQGKESGWGRCLESEYYSQHPKARNPVTPPPFSNDKRLPLREQADSYGMCYQGLR